MNAQAAVQSTQDWIADKYQDHDQKHVMPVMFLSLNPASVGLAFLLVLSLILKRKSLQPGGYLFLYSRREVRKKETRRRRRVRDTLNDPLLVQHWEKRWQHTLGSEELARKEIQSWRNKVERWEKEGDDEFKDAVFYKWRGYAVIPALRLINKLLLLIFFISLIFHLPYTREKDLTLICLACLVVHAVDNRLVERKHQKARPGQTAPSMTDSSESVKVASTELIAAVGMPTDLQLNVV